MSYFLNRLLNLLKYPFLLFVCYISYTIVINFDLLFHYTNKKYIIVFIITVALYSVLFKGRALFWEVFFHETTHALASVLTLNSVKGLTATINGGDTSYTGSENWIIDLAPYIISVHTVVIAFIYLFINYNYQIYIKYAIIISYAIFISNVIKQFSPIQTDIKSAGKIFSYMLVPQVNLLFGIYMLFFINGKVGLLYKICSR